MDFMSLLALLFSLYVLYEQLYIISHPATILVLKLLPDIDTLLTLFESSYIYVFTDEDLTPKSYKQHWPFKPKKIFIYFW